MRRRSRARKKASRNGTTNLADPLHRIVPSTSVDRTVAVDRERDRERGRDKEKAKRGESEAPAEAPPAEEIEDETAPDPKKGHGVDIKV